MPVIFIKNTHFTVGVMMLVIYRENTNMTEIEKLKLKLRMMEISFEQINNSRNDMIKQLANTEGIIEKIEEWYDKQHTWQGVISWQILKEILQSK